MYVYSDVASEDYRIIFVVVIVVILVSETERRSDGALIGACPSVAPLLPAPRA